MDIFDERSIKIFDEKVEPIVEEAKKTADEKFAKYEVSREEKEKVLKIVVDHIKKNKLKLYGGYAQHMALRSASDDPDACIYSDAELEFPDLDFYSPDPLQTLFDLCNEIYQAGYEDTQGREALHGNTYRVYCNGVQYADITYVPKNIYHKMPFIEYDGMNLIHPHFSMIDIFIQFNDPMLSFWRLQKVFHRMNKMVRFFPMKRVEVPLKLAFENKLDPKIRLSISEAIAKKDTMIMIGKDAFNTFYRESGISKSKDHKHIKELDLPYVEAISINYVEDVESIVNMLKEKFPKYKNDIGVIEYYKFFTFYGNNCIIYVHDQPAMMIFDNNKYCYPFRQIDINKVIPESKLKKQMLMGTFDMVIMLEQMLAIRYRVSGDKDRFIMYNGIVSHLLQIREYYLNDKKKTIFDDGIFNAFSIECMGDTIPPIVEHNQLIKRRIKDKKAPIFQYRPRDRIQNTPPKFLFRNASGNVIQNEKNKKLFQKNDKTIAST